MKLLKFHGKPKIPVYDSSHRFALSICVYIEDATTLKLVTYFYLYSAFKKNSFCFCSCSEFLQLKCIEEEEKFIETQIARPPRLRAPEDREAFIKDSGFTRPGSGVIVLRLYCAN